ncbi:unnamed protein product [Urochloa humidicola]
MDECAAAAAVGRVLADHPGPFRKVQLTCCVSGCPKRELVEWARLLAAKDVRDLVLLDVHDFTWHKVRRLPNDILSCVSLHRLFLGYWIFPDTAALFRHGVQVAFPLLKYLSVFHTNMRDKDLDHMLSCSPVLEILALALSKYPKRIRLKSQSLQCILLFMYLAEELAVVDTPHLERLILWMTCVDPDDESGDERMAVKINRAPVLRVLGYLEPRVHQLHIGNVVINAETAVSPSSVVPNVKILALKVNFGIFEDFSMLPSFLGCFPNIETLHIESSVLGEGTGRLNAIFWEEIHPIECLKSHVKEIVIHESRGDQGEFEFLKFIIKHAQKLQSLMMVLTKEKSASADKVYEVNCQLRALCACTWPCATENCKVLLLGSEEENEISFRRASDLSVEDPFA